MFVEEFILDRTLNPAIDEFGLDTVRMIDPTCGSGHFLLGGFARLFDLWMKRESNEIVAAQKALDGVWGVDINPFAVAIARFRLIVAAVQACGIKRLKDAPGWKIHLATGDSLLFGSRWNRSGEKVQEQTWFATDEGSLGSRDLCLRGQGGASGGAGPAVSRRRRESAVHHGEGHGAQRGLSQIDTAPAIDNTRLACRSPSDSSTLHSPCENGRCGYVGMITANSFMKREFGKKLIEEFFPEIDLTHVVDTSGAYIPGHGTPTVILFGRNRKPVGDAVRAVLGIKGEPSTPDDPPRGWCGSRSSIRSTERESQDEFIIDGGCASDDVRQASVEYRRWRGGGLKEQIEDAADSYA